MRPLNQGTERIPVPDKLVDHQDNLAVMEKGTTSGKVAKNGAWANLKGALRVRGKGSFSETSSSSIELELESVETEYFDLTPEYVSDCLKLPHVKEYLKASRYRKPVYLITGVKVGNGVSAHIVWQPKTQTIRDPEAGCNCFCMKKNKQSRAEENAETENTQTFSGYDDIVVAIQCLKISQRNGCSARRRRASGSPVESLSTQLARSCRKRHIKLILPDSEED